MRKRRILTDNCLNQGIKGEKKRGNPHFLLFLPPTPPPSFPRPGWFRVCGKHMASFISTKAGWGPSVPSLVAGFERASVWVLVVRKKSWSVWTISKLASHPLPRLGQATDHPRCPKGMVSVALHLNGRILNRFMQKLQWRQAAGKVWRPCTVWRGRVSSWSAVSVSVALIVTVFCIHERSQAEGALEAEWQVKWLRRPEQLHRLPWCGVHSVPDVSVGYQAARLNGSRVSLAAYLKSPRSYSNTQLLWCKQRQLVTHYYRYGVYKNATLMHCELCMMTGDSVWQPTDWRMEGD